MNQRELNEEERAKIFNDYFSIFPFDLIGSDSVGFDMGCGSGRWAALIAPKVKKLVCIDASQDAMIVAENNLADFNNIEYKVASVDQTGFGAFVFDFGYSLGVLHHLPDTSAGIESCAILLKPGAPFLMYLYFAFDNKPFWYKIIWKLSELLRKSVNKLPPVVKSIVTDILAIVLYWPTAQLSSLAERLGFSVDNFPLSYYRDKSFYTMRTDSRDRFGTPLERRFSKNEIRNMLEIAGFEKIQFSESRPYWVSVAIKK